MYFFVIALTCVVFAVYVLFVVVYRKPAALPKPVRAVQPKRTTKSAATKSQKTQTAQPTAQAKAQKTVQGKVEEKKATEEKTTKATAKKAEAKKPVKPAEKKQAKKAKNALPKKIATSSSENLSDFEKLEAGEEDISEGWEIMKRRKPKKEVPAAEEKTDDKADDSEAAASTETATKPADKATNDKAKEPASADKKKPQDRDRPKREPREPRNRDRDRDSDRKNRKTDDKNPRPFKAAQENKKEKEAQTRPIRSGNYFFSRVLPSYKPGQENVFATLSQFIDSRSTCSGDTEPLKTAHLEMRAYKKAPQAAAQVVKPGAVWEAMAKYNYTNKAQSEDKEEGEGESDSGTTEMPFAKEEELVDCFLRSLGAKFAQYLNKAHMEKGKPQRFLSQSDIETAKQDLVKLMTQGVSVEPPVCHEDKQGATEFVENVFKQFDQSSLHCFSRMASRLWARGFADEGFFLFDNNKIALFWFIGYD